MQIKANKVEQNQQTYFFEREDGTIFHTNLKEAWTIYAGRAQKLGERVMRPKFIGSSDGSIFRQAVIEAHRIMNEKGIEEAQKLLKEAEKQELEKARLNPRPPINCDTVDKRGNPTSLSQITL